MPGFLLFMSKNAEIIFKMIFGIEN